MLEGIKEELDIKERTPSTFHSLIADKLREKNDNPNTDIIKRKLAKKIMCEMHTIPTRLFNDFLKEMENYDLIKITDKQNIEILKKEDAEN